MVPLVVFGEGKVHIQYFLGTTGGVRAGFSTGIITIDTPSSTTCSVDVFNESRCSVVYYWGLIRVDAHAQCVLVPS